jgi:beta-lactamase regulating signal transducer with metallopeptidase domain
MLLSLSTFLYLTQQHWHTQKIVQHSLMLQQQTTVAKDLSSPFSLRHIPEKIQSALQPNMHLILFVWCIGATIFILRMVSGWWYISRLQSEATVITNEWHNLLQNLADQLHIKRIVSLAQSAQIHVPLVIGFLKPIILVPTGMFSGLSSEQIETIFIHELAHIRRHDYIINIIQSFIEALFFFNPFIWILSGIIRREREYCCDDTVLLKGNPLAYARALARLEEERLSKAMFAMALAENKHQLLNRIKRIMEKSAKNYSGKDRLVPALLLVVGLVCASWLTIHTDRPSVAEKQKSLIVAADTIKKPGNTKHSTTTIITFDETGEPHEQVIESFEGEDDFDFEMPPIGFDVPDFPVMPVPSVLSVPVFPTLPDIGFYMPSIPAMPAIEPFDFSIHGIGFDTIPGAYHFRSQGDWEEFSKAFEEKFREQFGDFYKTHEKDFDKMMKELQENFAERFSDDEVHALYDKVRAMAEHEHVSREMERLRPHHAEVWEDAHQAQKEMMEHQQEMQKSIQQDMKEREQEMHERGEEMKMREQELREMEAGMKKFKKELKELLVKDGYIQERDEIKNINWDDDGEIEVNGKKIKDSDRQRYNDLHNKYFKGGHYRYVD